MQTDSKKIRIAFFGTPDFTVEFLELFKLQEQRLNFEIALVVTGEDKPFGRGMQLKSPVPKIWGDLNKIKVLQPEKLNSIESELIDFDLFIVIAYGKIIPEKIINLPKFGTINLHYSLLPKWRGASPVESAILNNEKVTGITIQQMVYKLDAGNILFQEEMQVLDTETTTELRNKLNNKARDIFPEFLNKLFSTSPSSGSLTLQRRGELGQVQDESLATKCGKFSKQDFNITEDLVERNLEKIYRKYKAFDRKIYFLYRRTLPHPASPYKGEERVRIKITSMTRDEDGEIKILRVLPESKKEISLKEFEKAFGKIF